ncbi:twitching motility protein [Thermodesulfobacteriota bacterium]
MKLNDNQSALILEIDDHGEISIEVASRDHEGLTALLCQAIAKKLIRDEEFQEELMAMINDER